MFSCNIEKKSTFDVKYFKKHKIAFANSEIFLPKNFKKTEIKDYILLIKDEDFLFDKNNLFEKLESSPFEKLVFYDINNYSNVIFILEGEHIYMNKNRAKEIVSILNSNFIYSKDADFKTYKKIENRYREYDKIQLLKSKFLISKPHDDFYQTIYLVSTLNKSFMIVDINMNNINLDDCIINSNFN